MTTENEAPVGQPADASGEAGKSQENHVSYDTYKKTLEEAKKAKARLREFEEAERKRAEDELAKQGEYKKLLTARDEELNTLRSQMTDIKRKEEDRRKLASVLNAAGGDIDSKWFGLVPYDDVVINPETGDVDEMSVARAVDNLKKTFPEIIKNPNAPRFPAAAPQGTGSGKISRSEWLKLPLAEMKKWKFDQIE